MRAARAWLATCICAVLVRGHAGGGRLRALDGLAHREPRAGGPCARSRDDARGGRPGLRGARDRAGAACSACTPGSRSSPPAQGYTVYEVIGWRLLLERFRGGDPEPAAGRALVRRRARIDRRQARRGRGRADRAHRAGSPAPIPGPGNTRSGPGRTPTPSPPGYCARCRSSRPTFRRPRSARTTHGDTLDRHRPERERLPVVGHSGCSG